MQSQSVSPKVCFNYKGKDSNATVEKSSRNYLTLEISITSDKLYQHYEPKDAMP